MSEPATPPGLLGHQIHDDLEYAVGGVYTRDAALAIVLAVETALGAGGNGAAVLDVIVWSEAGARAYGGDAAAAVYAEDPDASVHDRIVITAISQGRVA
jgi:hypothetical protein